MADFVGRKWKKSEFLSFVGDPLQAAGAQPFQFTEGKAQGVRGIMVNTGGGLSFTVLPGRGMDIVDAQFRGISLHFLTGTGITSPAYYDEPGLQWLRSFFGGLLTTCGITNAGAPTGDQGEPFGLHGRVSNSDAENVCVRQGWKGDEFIISLQGTVREASALGEYLTLTRKIETRLGWKGFRLSDVIENHRFEPQPLMMLYHFNFGFPLLGPNAKVVGPIQATEPRDEEAKKNGGVEECMVFPEPQRAYKERVFFHTLGTDREGKTFISLLNPDLGDGTPLGVVLRFKGKELPRLTEWKMPGKGFYVLGLEPGTVTAMGRGKLREKGELSFLDGQDSYAISIDFQVLETRKEMESLEREARSLAG